MVNKTFYDYLNMHRNRSFNLQWFNKRITDLVHTLMVGYVEIGMLSHSLLKPRHYA